MDATLGHVHYSSWLSVKCALIVATGHWPLLVKYELTKNVVIHEHFFFVHTFFHAPR